MKLIEHLEGMVSSRIVIAKGIYALFKLEAKLAGLNMLPLLFSLGVLIVLIITSWLVAMVLIGYLLILLTKQPLIAITIVLLLNLGLLFYVIRDLKLRLEQMSFKKTRDCLAKPQKKDAHESTKERSIDLNSPY